MRFGRVGRSWATVIGALVANALVAGVSSAGPVPVSDRFGLCINLPGGEGEVRIYAPVDTVFAVLQDKGRALVQLRIDTMPGEGLRAAERRAEAAPGWSSGSFFFDGPVSGGGDLIVVKNDQSDLYRNLFITVSRAASLPSWIDVSALEHSISHCGKNAPAAPSAPPVLDASTR